MDNLVIGNTSQLSYYFPDNYFKISSRNIDFNFLKNKWNSVYITFAEQRIRDNDIDFMSINYHYIMKIIDNLIDHVDKIVIYTSCELWNKHTGIIDINKKIDYDVNGGMGKYLLSKEALVKNIINLRNFDSKYKKVIIIHPFYFNSTYRNEYFLFGKIFNSIINKTKVEIGDTYFHRDMVHANYVVSRSINCINDEIVGSGELHNVNKFIRDLYKYFNMSYEFYVKENINNYFEKSYYSYQKNIYTYDMLLNDTIKDIELKIK